MSLIYEKIVKEDLNIGVGTTAVTSPAGGTMTGTKIGLHTFTGSSILNVDDYGAVGDGTSDDTTVVAAAIDAVATRGGGTVLFPAKNYKLTSQITTAIPSSTARLKLEGVPGAILSLGADLADNDTAMLEFTGSPTRGQVTIEGLKLHGNSHTGTGIKVDQASERTTLLDVSVREFLGRGAWLYKCIGATIRGGHFLTNGYGVEVGGVSSIGEGLISGVKFEGNTTRNLFLGTGITFMEVSGCTFYGTSAKSLEIADGAFCIGIRSCSFEQANESIYSDGSWNAVTIENCLIPCQSTSGTKYGIYLGGNATNCRIAQNIFTQEADAGCTVVSVRIVGIRTNLVIGPNYFSPSGAGTNTDYSPADLSSLHGVIVDDALGVGTTAANEASAILEVKSTTKGFLPPRMSSGLIQNITPAEGLIVYDTTLHRPYCYNGTRWEPMTTGTD